MSIYTEKAVALFREGYNCAQSVVGAFHEEMGLSLSEATRLASSFGGGMGGQRQGHPQGDRQSGLAGHRSWVVGHTGGTPGHRHAERARTAEGERAGADGAPTLPAGRQVGGMRATGPRHLVRISLSLLVWRSR